MRAVAYEPAHEEAWDALVARAPMGTFLHTRRYLGYHGDRFADASVVLLDDDGDDLRAVLPAAADPDDGAVAVSHPGITYGGVVHDGRLLGEETIAAFEAIGRHLAGRGFRCLRYKPVPRIYERGPSADDAYALWCAGARLYRVDLSCAIDLAARRRPSSRRVRGAKRARSAGVEVRSGGDLAAPLWSVIEENLARRHGARPVHTLEEIQRLAALFPDEIGFTVAEREGRTIAGVVTFSTDRVVKSQYIASDEEAMEVAALDAVFEHLLERAAESGRRFFDFGTSNEEQGRVLNAGLYRFKAEFGGGGVPYEFHELPL